MFGMRKSRLEDSLAEAEAIGRSQAVIEFRLDGTIVKANQNFLDALGYGALSEIEGKHHRIFMPQSDAERADYKEFWARLNRGEYQTGEFKRMRKDGRPVWIQASLQSCSGRSRQGHPGHQVRDRHYRQENEGAGGRGQDGGY